MSAVYPFTSCVRIDSLASTRGPLGALLRVARWLARLELPIP